MKRLRPLLNISTLCLALLLLATGSLASALVQAGRLVHPQAGAWLLTTAFSASLLAWILGSSRLPNWLTLPCLALAGALWVVIALGNLWPLILNWLQKFPPLVPQLLDWPNFSPDWLPLRAAAKLIQLEASWFLARLAQSIEGLRAGNAARDPLALAFFWSLVVWLLAAWAGWIVRHYWRPGLALFPGLGLLAALLNYQGLDPLLMALPLGASLLLLAATSYQRRQAAWRKDKLDFAEDIGSDWLIVTGLVVVAILSLAALLPSFSLRSINAWARQLTQPAAQNSAPLVEALGLALNTPTPQAAGRPMAVSNQHLLGQRPELSQNTIFYARILEPRYSPQPALTDVLPEAINALAPRYYWRVATYDIYTGAGWRSSAHQSKAYPANEAVFDPIPANRSRLLYQIEPTVDLGGMLYTNGSLIQVDQEYQIAWRQRPPKPPSSPEDFLLADAFSASLEHGSYQALSALPAVTGAGLRAAEGAYPAEIAERYLQLPAELPLRLRELAIQVTSGHENAYDQALAIEHFMRQFSYSLETSTPDRGRDVVDYFIFESQAGFCDYYASAMAVLAWAVGLPARLVLGYAPGQYDLSQQRYEIVEADAHSWVEIYFNGIGWVEFEPTASQPAILHPNSGQVLSEVTLPEAAQPDKEEGIGGRWIGTLLQVAFIGLLGVLVLGALLAQVMLLRGLIEAWWWRRQAPQHVVIQVYSQLRHEGARLLESPPSGDTPYEFSDRLQARFKSLASQQAWGAGLSYKAIDIQQITASYIQAVYSSKPISAETGGQIIATWQRLRRTLRSARILAALHRKLSRIRSGAKGNLD